ncbi:GNAT family N-acetyltransferase [Paenibacillus terrae]|nr:GNAT family N-acetyltransferase [Paenibacillus terrae]
MRSMQKAPGYKQKLDWTEEGYNSGLVYVQLKIDKKPVGFIEYAPGEAAWRVVHADGYMVIHCLWVGVTGMGYGTQLIQQCIQDAKQLGKKGVVVLSNADTSWAPESSIFKKNGFEYVGKAPYSFELYVYKFRDDPNPYFPDNWNERLERFNQGLTILRTDQCPYLEVATQNIIQAAKSVNIEPEIIHIRDRSEMMELSPTPYGVFNVIFQGQLISFHRLTPHSFAKKLIAIIKD